MKVVTHFIARGLRTTMRQMKSHYETLGLGPSASQAEVKAAYYKKSLELHPDRVRGNREQFEEVAIAYKTLSDPSIRKLYDKTQRVQAGNNSDSRPHFGPQLGKTPVYDFDRWTRLHYGAAVKRQVSRKQAPRQPDFHAVQRENVTLAVACIILCAVFLSLVNQTAGAKQASTSPNKKTTDEQPTNSSKQTNRSEERLTNSGEQKKEPDKQLIRSGEQPTNSSKQTNRSEERLTNSGKQQKEPEKQLIRSGENPKLKQTDESIRGTTD
ncbi:hypothetical protein GE061_006888 [Apolygus lucorum]|uniref:J domain-containing protein n=1 Tax=Apolygus lucorum TaxID=248454 RepID=A0A8S9WTZ6_APOLU|nr:hypothetical protein GE061_006888 [Apolygus lucorum]